jgi:hypothetical protein
MWVGAQVPHDKPTNLCDVSLERPGRSEMRHVLRKTGLIRSNRAPPSRDGACRPSALTTVLLRTRRISQRPIEFLRDLDAGGVVEVPVGRVPDAVGRGLACHAAEGCDANGDRCEDDPANDDGEEGRTSGALAFDAVTALEFLPAAAVAQIVSTGLGHHPPLSCWNAKL